MLPVIKNQKKSMLDETGKPMIGFYDDYGYLNLGAGYWVVNNRKAGIVKYNGDTILPIEYNKIFATNQVKEYERERNKLIGKINDRYYIISFLSIYPSDLSIEKISPISPLSKDPVALWEPMPNFDKAPELEQILDSKENLYTLTKDIQEHLKEKYSLDSVQKEPLQIFDRGNMSIPFYKVFKSGKIGLWNSAHFIYPKYNNIQQGSYYKISFIAEFNKKFGIISEDDETLAPFKYNKIENTYWGPFITSVKNKYGVLILNGTYPNIENRYDKIELVQMLPVNSNWYFALFKVRKQGKEGFVGENGIEYFKD